MKRKKLIFSESSLIDLIASTVMEAMGDDTTPTKPTRKSLGLDKKMSIVAKAVSDADDVDGHSSNADYGIKPNKNWGQFWADWHENDKAYRAYGFEEPIDPSFTCVQIAGAKDHTKRVFNEKWNNLIEPCGTDWDGTEPYAPQKSKTFKRVGQKCKRSTSCPRGCMCHNKRGVSGINPIGGPTVHGINFKNKYGHTQEEFRDIFRDAALKAKRKAIDWIIEYYSEDNPDNFNKLVPSLGARGLYTYATTKLGVPDHLYGIKRASYKKLKDKLLDMREHTYSMVIHYCCEGDFYGWVQDSEHLYRYNINLYNFTNPTDAGWEHSLFSVTLHELGHLVDNILVEDLGVDPYPGDLYQDDGDNTAYEPGRNEDKDSRGAYVTRKTELYARIFNLRWYFGVTSNISAQEWAKLFMDKVNAGEIEWAPPTRYKNYRKGSSTGFFDSSGNRILKPKWVRKGGLVYLEFTTKLIHNMWPNATDWSSLKSPHDGKPKTYSDVWELTSLIRYNVGDDPDAPTEGYRESGIGAFLATFTLDPANLKVDQSDPNKFWVVFDFNRIAEANRLYVSVDPDELVTDSDEFAALEKLYDGLKKPI